MQIKPIMTLLSALFGIGVLMMASISGAVSAQIDPTSQHQTVEAAVAQRLNATATARAALASTATIQAAFETAVAATAQAQQTTIMDATLVESMILTAVMDSVQATQQAELAALGNMTITRNADWTPIERDFDGVTMVFVPAGCFEMGLKGDAIAELKTEYPSASEIIDSMGPVHLVCISEPFWLDKTEVTQAQFREKNGVKANTNYFLGDNRPVENISWFEAQDYCELRGGRLPTEAEWEYASRGPDSLVYSWGNDFVEDNAVYRANSNGETFDVGSMPSGASWVGALDLSSNVYEWVSSLYALHDGNNNITEQFNYPYDLRDGREANTGASTNVYRVLRGGSWGGNITYGLMAAYRDFYIPSTRYFDWGVRCARSQ